MAKTREQIEQLDFDQVKIKMMAPTEDEGKAWTAERVDFVERQYRNLLYLVAKYGDDVLAPTFDIDEFWHMHILDTRRYGDDMTRIFGRMIHHDPYMGAGGDDDVQELVNAFDRTAALYLSEFGHEYIQLGFDAESR